MRPRIKRFFKKVEDFVICAEIGDKNVIGVEYPEARKTLYQYVIKGSAYIHTIDQDRYDNMLIDDNDKFKLFDVKKFIHSRVILSSEEDFMILGFNTTDKSIDWSGKIIKESFTGDSGWLICLNGHPIVNGKKLNRFDYAKVSNKFYDVQLNDGIIGVFTKI